MTQIEQIFADKFNLKKIVMICVIRVICVQFFLFCQKVTENYL